MNRTLTPSDSGTFRRLLILGTAQLLLWCAVAFLSRHFDPESDYSGRPLLSVLVLLWSGFVLYAASFRALLMQPIGARNSEEKRICERSLIRLVLVFAFLFRIPLWWSMPIQEIDIYRYLWDGRVLTESVRPYRYSPAEVDQASEDVSAPTELKRLIALRDRTTSLRTIFDRIDHREVPTVYPPLSQVVFGAAAWITPESAPVFAQVRVLKALLLLFDIITIFCIIGLLRSVKKPVSLALVYAWCPLVLKEFANSGHLDSIAVCLTTAALWLLVRKPELKAGAASSGIGPRSFLARQYLAGALWAGAILAKFYPLVLAPLLLVWWWRRIRWRVLVVAVVITGVMITGYAVIPGGNPSGAGSFSVSTPESGSPHIPNPRNQSFGGLGKFLNQWEINDLLFSCVYENLRTASHVLGSRPPPWYAVFPEKWRTALSAEFASFLSFFGMNPARLNVPFLLAQSVSGLILLGIAIRLATMRWQVRAEEDLLRRSFLCIAWLWFLSATQNPWYWTWSLPFVVFASRPWFLVSGLALFYYLRFWLIHRFPDSTLLGGMVDGRRFFDELVVWAEHLPILLWLLFQNFTRKGNPG